MTMRDSESSKEDIYTVHFHVDDTTQVNDNISSSLPMHVVKNMYPEKQIPFHLGERAGNLEHRYAKNQPRY